MLPKFRFGTPIKRADAWKKRVNFLYFFLAWNAFGLVIYDIYKRNRKKDPEWENLTSAQKYLKLVDIHTIGEDGKVIYRKYDGLHKIEEKETTLDSLKEGKI